MLKGVLTVLALVIACSMVSLGGGRQANAEFVPLIDQEPAEYFAYAQKMARLLGKRVPPIPDGGKCFERALPFLDACYWDIKGGRIEQGWQVSDYNYNWRFLFKQSGKYRYPKGQPCESMKTLSSCRLLLVIGATIWHPTGSPADGEVVYMATFRSVRKEQVGWVPKLDSLKKVKKEVWRKGRDGRVIPRNPYPGYYNCPGFLLPCRSR